MSPTTIIIDLELLVRKAGIKSGDVVADLGTGREGKIALLASPVVGDSGVVYAVDVVKTILPAVATKAKMHGLNNVQTVWSDLEVYGATRAIRDNMLAAAFLVTILFQSQKRAAILQEAARMVRPGGKLIIVDWKPGVEAPLGPSEHQRVSADEIKQLAIGMGLQVVDEFAAGPYHWGMVAVK